MLTRRIWNIFRVDIDTVVAPGKIGRYFEGAGDAGEFVWMNSMRDI